MIRFDPHPIFSRHHVARGLPPLVTTGTACCPSFVCRPCCSLSSTLLSPLSHSYIFSLPALSSILPLPSLPHLFIPATPHHACPCLPPRRHHPPPLRWRQPSRPPRPSSGRHPAPHRRRRRRGGQVGSVRRGSAPRRARRCCRVRRCHRNRRHWQPPRGRTCPRCGSGHDSAALPPRLRGGSGRHCHDRRHRHRRSGVAPRLWSGVGRRWCLTRRGAGRSR